MCDFDINSASSIIEFAKKLKDRTLLEVCGTGITEHGYRGKGNFGQILEKFYFGYEPNSDADPDFKEAALELKSSPLKILKNGEYRSKERLVLNIINYLEVYKETFESSSFWKKNAHLLLIFYLWEKDLNIIDYVIKLVDDWRYSSEDLKIIKHDWETINQKIKDGKAHEISEGDTFYLGACTKGSTAKKSLRDQPFNTKKAKQRAYSLKQGYVNHIIAKIAKDEKDVFGKIIQTPSILDKEDIESFIVSKFKPFYGKTAQEIEAHFKLSLNQKAKNYFANLTKAMLGIGFDKRIEEFEKADIIVKTIRLREDNLPKEDISFPTFKYEDIINTEWEDSDFKNILESKFFFVFYQLEADKLILRKVKFWNMSQSDIKEVERVWSVTKKNIKAGKIVQSISDSGRRLTYFPKKAENRISHVRPHALNANDTYPLPFKDRFTGLRDYTKHCFWLNAKYVKEEIYEKE